MLTASSQEANWEPRELFTSAYSWNREDLVIFAKDSFRGFKEAYKGQIDAEKQAKLMENERSNRRAGRRREVSVFLRIPVLTLTGIQKVTRRRKAIPKYIELHARDPSQLLCESHMSDDASGPEDEDEESRDDWKARMATERDLLPGIEITKIKFLETVKPEWRSEKVIRILVTIPTSKND